MSTTLGFLEVYQSNMLGQIIIGFLLHAWVLRYGMVFPLLLKRLLHFANSSDFGAFSRPRESNVRTL